MVISRLSQVFICYRREDTAGVTGRLYDRLVQRFGRESIFKDVDSIPLGYDFKRYIDSVIGQCSVVLIVIGRHWTTLTDKSGKRRLDDAHDFVRIEVETALRRNIPVIPVLVDDVSMPPEEELPETIKDLTYRHGISVGHDPHFHSDVDRLIKNLQIILEGQREEKIKDKKREAAELRPSAVSDLPARTIKARPNRSSIKARLLSLKGLWRGRILSLFETVTEYALSLFRWARVGKDRRAYRVTAIAIAIAVTLALVSLFIFRSKTKKYSPTHTEKLERLIAEARWEEAQAEAIQAINAEPDKASHHWSLGYIFSKQDQWSEAENAYRRAIQLDKDKAWYHADLANALGQRKKRDEAEIEYREAIRLNPSDAGYHARLAYVLQSASKCTEAQSARSSSSKQKRERNGKPPIYNPPQDGCAAAEAEYRRAIELAPDNLSPYAGLATLLKNQGKWAEAEAPYREAVRLEPQDKQLRLDFILVLRQQSKHADVEAEYRKLLGQESKNKDFLSGLAEALYKQNKLAEAESQFKQVLSIDLNNTDALSRLGEIFVKTNNWSEAESVYRRLVHLNYNLLSYRFKLGDALLRQSKWSEAEVVYREGVQSYPDDGDYHANLARALYMQGKIQSARVEARKALQLGVAWVSEESVNQLLR